MPVETTEAAPPLAPVAPSIPTPSLAATHRTPSFTPLALPPSHPFHHFHPSYPSYPGPSPPLSPFPPSPLPTIFAFPLQGRPFRCHPATCDSNSLHPSNPSHLSHLFHPTPLPPFPPFPPGVPSPTPPPPISTPSACCSTRRVAPCYLPRGAPPGTRRGASTCIPLRGGKVYLRDLQVGTDEITDRVQ